MIDFKGISNSSTNSNYVPKAKKLYFLLLWLGTNILLWSMALIYLKIKHPTYKSNWSINLPAAASNTNVNVPEIGQAFLSVDSPYRTFADPRENYKILAESDQVLEAAANQLKMPLKKFGKAQIKIIDNTTLMRFEISGSTPKEAQQKALALHGAFEVMLEQLRKQEIAQQERSLEDAMSSDQQKLEVAKQRLYDYKASSRLNSSEQLRDLSLNVEGLRRQRAETVAQLQQASARVQQLSISLGLSDREAADALALESDRLFQQYLANYTQVSAELVNLTSKYAPAHPMIIAKQSAKDAAQAALLQEAQSLLGRPISTASLAQIMLSGGGSSDTGSHRANLFQELISLQAQQRGVQAQVQGFDQQIAQLESRLGILSQQESKLDSLQRDTKIAEAVFSSNLTKLNLSKSALAGSYPQIAIVTRPSLAKESSGPKSKLVVMGALAGSFFLTTGTVSLWWRDRKIQQTKQKLTKFTGNQLPTL